MWCHPAGRQGQGPSVRTEPGAVPSSQPDHKEGGGDGETEKERWRNRDKENEREGEREREKAVCS